MKIYRVIGFKTPTDYATLDKVFHTEGGARLFIRYALKKKDFGYSMFHLREEETYISKDNLELSTSIPIAKFAL